MRFLSILILVPFLSGCYTYSVAEPGVPTRGSVVRASLDPTVAVSLGEVAVQQAGRVTGEVVVWEPNDLVMSASTVVAASGQDYLGRGYTVRLPRSALAGLEERTLDPWRTALLTGAGIAGAVVLGMLAREGFGSGSGEGSGGQPQ